MIEHFLSRDRRNGKVGWILATTTPSCATLQLIPPDAVAMFNSHRLARQVAAGASCFIIFSTVSVSAYRRREAQAGLIASMQAAGFLAVARWKNSIGRASRGDRRESRSSKNSFDRCAVHHPFRAFDTDFWHRLLRDPVDGRPGLRNLLGFIGASSINRPSCPVASRWQAGKCDFERFVVIHQVTCSLRNRRPGSKPPVLIG